MEHVDGKIVDFKADSENLELIIAEHKGVFKSTGVMKLLLDRTAAFDFFNAVDRVSWKGGNPLLRIGNKLKRRRIRIIVN